MNLESEEMKASGPRIIAIPCFGEEVAPTFGSARRFRVWVVDRDRVVDYREVAVDEGNGLGRIRLMRRLGVRVVICNGIEALLRQMLEAEGCLVIDHVVGTAADVLFGYLAGRVLPGLRRTRTLGTTWKTVTADTVEWTIELFSSHGWALRRVVAPEFFPVDLVAERTCPVCGKPLRVAICCGAHAYRVDEEIREFQRVTAFGYHARAYVHQDYPEVLNACRAYGIEVLDPAAFALADEAEKQGEVPPLRGAIREHGQLNQIA